MKLSYITIMVRDIEKSIIFYEELAGLQIVRRFNPGQGEIVFLANAEGETMLELIEFKDVEKVAVKGMVMSYQVEDELEKVREKAIILGYNPTEIINFNPKPMHFKVSDPDGITVEFSI